MGFDYDRDTREYYRDPTVAREYHSAFTDREGWRSLRFRFVAERERRTVQALLAQVPHDKVLDIPAGTGKLAPVFATAGSVVTACDTSRAMLEIARDAYGARGYDEVSFAVVELENASRTLEKDFDVAVCLRLMHRVPDEVKRGMLEQLRRLAPFSIVSFAVQNPFHAVRGYLRRLFLGGEDVGITTRHRRSRLESLVRNTHSVVDARPIARGLSAEWIYLLRARSKD